MRANLFSHCCPGALSPARFLLLPLVPLMLGWSRLPSSRKPLSPASKKRRRTSPCPGHVVGQEKAELQCWEEKEPAALAGFHPRTPRAAAPPGPSLSQACTKFMIRSGEQRGSVERALAWEEESPP